MNNMLSIFKLAVNIPSDISGIVTIEEEVIMWFTGQDSFVRIWFQDFLITIPIVFSSSYMTSSGYPKFIEMCVYVRKTIIDEQMKKDGNISCVFAVHAEKLTIFFNQVFEFSIISPEEHCKLICEFKRLSRDGIFDRVRDQKKAINTTDGSIQPFDPKMFGCRDYI